MKRDVTKHRTVTEKTKDGMVLRVQDAFVPNSKQAEFFHNCADPYADEILYDGSIRAGKQLDLRTPIPTPSGWTTMGDLRDGDTIFDDQGDSCTVVQVHPIDERPVSYRVRFDDGEEINACADHLWLTFTQQERNQKVTRTDEWRAARRDRRPSDARGIRAITNETRTYTTLPPPTGTVRSTAEIAETLHLRHSIPNAAPLDGVWAKLPVTPYVLGAWLGDGTSCDGSITCDDPPILAEIEADGYPTRRQPSKQYGYGILGLSPELRRAGLLNNKHIPAAYLRAAPEQRLALLQGLMDTDGSTNGSQVEFYSVSEKLAQQVCELVRTLGWKPVAKVKWGRYKGEPHRSYRVSWTATVPVFRLQRKINNQRVATDRSTSRSRYIVAVEPIEPVPMRCITVDSPSRLYLAGDAMVPTHNTQACCKQIVAWAWQYGGRYVVARKTYPELRDSTMAVMLRGEGGMPPACPPELVKEFRAGDRELHLLNGAEILFRNLESAEEGRAKLRNISLNGFFIDQVEELDGDEWGEFYEELMGRLSDPRGPGKMVMAANPGPTDHWVWKRFIDPDLRDRFPQTRYVHCTLYDNQENLDPKYFQSRIRTEKQNPEYYKRMVLGEWGAFGGKRFKVWDSSKHLIDPFTVPAHWEVIEGLDYGYAHPFATVWIAIDPQDRYYVVAEHFERERAISHHARCIHDMRESLGVTPEVTWADPSIFEERGGTSSISMELNDYGIYPAKANRDRLGGWNRIEEMLGNEIDGKPQLQVFNTCKALIKELPNARFKEGGEDIQKMNDHALDSVRYAVMSRPPVPAEESEEEDFDRRTMLAHRMKEKALAREAGNFYHPY